MINNMHNTSTVVTSRKMPLNEEDIGLLVLCRQRGAWNMCTNITKLFATIIQIQKTYLISKFTNK